MKASITRRHLFGDVAPRTRARRELGAVLARGFNLGIDFKGGTVVEMQAKADKFDAHNIRETVHKLNLGEVEVQEFGTGRDVLLRVGLQPGGDKAQNEVVVKLRSVFEDKFEFRRINQQLMQSVKISHSGDTEFHEGDIVPTATFDEVNAQVEAADGRPAKSIKPKPATASTSAERTT